MNYDIYIDNENVTEQYGLYLLKGSMANMLCYPSIKESSIMENDWFEHTYPDVDLSSPKLKEHGFSMTFYLKDGLKTYWDIVNVLSSNTYHSFKFFDQDDTHTLRVSAISKLDQWRRGGTISITFSDDEPMRGYTYESPIENNFPKGMSFLDGKDMSSYGVAPLKGATSALECVGDIRKNPMLDTMLRDGVSCDYRGVHFKSNTASVPFVMVHDNYETFKRDWKALLFDLVRPDDHTINIYDSDDYAFYYKSCDVKTFAIGGDGRVWCEFSITMQLLSADVAIRVDENGDVVARLPYDKRDLDLSFFVDDAFDAYSEASGEAENYNFILHNGNLELEE